MARSNKDNMNRRSFLTRTTATVGAGLVGNSLLRPTRSSAALLTPPPLPAALEGKSRVSLTRGGTRRKNITDAMNLLRDEIRAEIGDRQVVIKPNVVRIDPKIALGMTHPDALRGVLDFLKPIYNKQVVIAENCGVGPNDTPKGYQALGYMPLSEEYNVALRDLADYGSSAVPMLDPDFRPRGIQISNVMQDDNVYLISLAIPKVHSLVGVTLSVKNMAMGAPVNGRGEKVKMHEQVMDPNFRKNPRDPNFNKMFAYNLFQMAHYTRPSLAVIDAWEGMERLGPTGGDPVPLHAAFAGTDWIAVDRVATDLMDINFHDIGYLHHCAEGGLGNGDMENIEVVGERVAAVKKPFKLIANHDELIVW
jgi:uncharacterized protein (DUF362 family)